MIYFILAGGWERKFVDSDQRFQIDCAAEKEHDGDVIFLNFISDIKFWNLKPKAFEYVG